MSRDNFVAVQKREGAWAIFDACASLDDPQPGSDVEFHARYDQALILAHTREMNGEYEYGVKVLSDYQEIDTTNKFLVGVRGEEICVLKPPPQAISKGDALNLAAWLVALANENDRFDKILNAVENT